MSSIKPSIPKGTRDFSPTEVARRNYIFDTIKNVFRKYGYQPIETPTMENLSTLTGKYGDEGDKLIFKILNSGDFLSGTTNVGDLDSKKITSLISEKALRYDLTVPFARYVVMHQNDIKFPFKRYQVQPVWRADRPQKGRYREFYQCDADVIGSASLLNEAELVMIYDEALSKLGLTDFTIKLNNRKLLSALSELINAGDKFKDIIITIDKFDKIGRGGVVTELRNLSLDDNQIGTIEQFLKVSKFDLITLDGFKELFKTTPIGLKGIEELEELYNYLERFDYSFLNNNRVVLDGTLARGLNYYTGAIIEVVSNQGTLRSSIGGGGRYDDLTGMFGLKNMTGVGISFGADRIYDVIEELNLFPPDATEGVKVMITRAEASAETIAFDLLKTLRDKNISSEIYHELQPGNFGKQLKYANDKGVPYVVLIGSNEVESGTFTIKNMLTGEQETGSKEAIISFLK